jgi:hypothetical protein
MSDDENGPSTTNDDKQAPDAPREPPNNDWLEQEAIRKKSWPWPVEVRGKDIED